MLCRSRFSPPFRALGSNSGHEVYPLYHRAILLNLVQNIFDGFFYSLPLSLRKPEIFNNLPISVCLMQILFQSDALTSNMKAVFSSWESWLCWNKAFSLFYNSPCWEFCSLECRMGHRVGIRIFSCWKIDLDKDKPRKWSWGLYTSETRVSWFCVFIFLIMQ